MTESDSLTVFVAESSQVADAVVALLASAGIAAETVIPPPEVMVEPLPGVTAMAGGSEILVRVPNAAQVADARGLIDSAVTAGVVKAIREKRANRTGTVVAECEECGAKSEWPAAAMGTTETCPHCLAYMDIPDPDDDWANVDVGEPEPDDFPAE
jgi:hypothetical protein